MQFNRTWRLARRHGFVVKVGNKFAINGYDDPAMEYRP